MTTAPSSTTGIIPAWSAATISSSFRLTVSNTRSIDQKQALYRRIVERLGKDPGIRPDDVMINLVDVITANWSFGRGVAQYVERDTR